MLGTPGIPDRSALTCVEGQQCQRLKRCARYFSFRRQRVYSLNRAAESESIDRSTSPESADSSRSQSERGLDSAEWSPEGEPEARASGKSDREGAKTSGGSGRSLSLSAGWEEVAAACHAEEGTGHE